MNEVVRQSARVKIVFAKAGLLPMTESFESIAASTLQNILRSCRSNSATIAAAVNECFGSSFSCRVGEPRAWQQAEPPAHLAGPGMAVAIEVEQHGLLCLIPASFPLPEWTSQIDPEAATRRNALSGELAKQLLPSDLIGGQHVGEFVADLDEEVVAANPTPQTTLIELAFEPADEEAADRPVSTVYLVYPVLNPPFPAIPQWPADDELDVPRPAGAARFAPSPANLQRVRNLPVTISVRLAEKRVPLGQLLSITPGGLITFNKSCEDLLDLYVNNHRYAQGEAVKIGEKFGLKVNQIGVVERRESRVK